MFDAPLPPNARRTHRDPACPQPALRGFSPWCLEELITPELTGAVLLLEHACDLLSIGLLRELGLAERLGTPRSAAELTAELGFVDSAAVALEALLFRLAEHTPHVGVDLEARPPRFRALAPAGDPSARLEEVRRELRSLGGGYEASMELVEFGARNFVRGLRDDPAFMDRVLAGGDPRSADLAASYDGDPLTEIHWIMGTRAAERCFEGGRILELGGGTGSHGRHLLRHLANAGRLDELDSYTFTWFSWGRLTQATAPAGGSAVKPKAGSFTADSGMHAMMRLRRELSREFPDLRTDWRYLDINEPFTEQRLAPASFDLVYGVNMAHNARDVVKFLRSCRECLRPGGRLVLAERVRTAPHEMPPRELPLNLSVYHRTAALQDEVTRPVHSYLPAESWRRALALAGFQDDCVCPQSCWSKEVEPSGGGAGRPGLPPACMRYAAVVIARRAE